MRRLLALSVFYPNIRHDPEHLLRSLRAEANILQRSLFRAASITSAGFVRRRRRRQSSGNFRRLLHGKTRQASLEISSSFRGKQGEPKRSGCSCRTLPSFMMTRFLAGLRRSVICSTGLPSTTSKSASAVSSMTPDCPCRVTGTGHPQKLAVDGSRDLQDVDVVVPAGVRRSTPK
jgi:hypothetical protein